MFRLVLLTTSQVANRLGVNVQTVRRMVKRGDLVAVRMSPKSFRFEPSEIARFIEERSEVAS